MTKPINEKQEIGRASAILALFTFLSRLLGLVRNQILSHFFGATMVADAFIAAFTIPNALRRLLGEGALTPSLVSTLTRAVKSNNAGSGWKTYINASFFWLNILLIVCCGLGIFFSDSLVKLYVPEFTRIPGKFELTVGLTQFLFPFIVLIGWSAFFMGVLNTFRSFGIAAFAPACISLAVILIVPAAYYFGPFPAQKGIYIFAGALLVGAFFQALMHAPSLLRLGAFPGFKIPFKDPRVMELALLLVPSFFSMGVYQINIIINRTFASRIEGAVSHLFYADLIIELPIALIATSLGTAVIPSFSRLLTESKHKELREAFHFSLESVWALALPCAAACLSIAVPLVSTLYFTGKFSALDLERTASALMAYGLGIPFFASLRIFLAFFFASKDTKTPFISGLIALFVNLIFAWKLSDSMGASGIALATTISSAANLLVLLAVVTFRRKDLQLADLWTPLFKIVTATLIMIIALTLSYRYLLNQPWRESGISSEKMIALSILMVLGSLSYFAACYLFKIQAAVNIAQRVKKRFFQS